MVKEIDDLRPDHIGWHLWEAAAQWKMRFSAGMIAAGHDWYGEARSGVIPYVDLNGTRQADIVQRMGLSKQAVQQLIVDLEQVGILHRVPDPADGRGKIVCFTEVGLAAQRDAAQVKREVENEMRRKLGAEAFDTLYALLKELAQPD
ncbi:MarR family winged helix-turn-helix transcriptional regulator [Thalassococcus sp. S3]|uniref:MarR family winged helix-turn-helix transcriptional regulator n=1 Tax=Thalassococcus sp. S3 TaxID=2017482 RepID=UPI00102C7F13|nr:MarR family winged helix-turn-helix transcriptional regulator [Thalassococcus sp. S3]